MQTSLTDTIEQDVKFSEVDSLGTVWHGHYLRYFEDGREAFGKKYGMGYLDFYSNGFVVPIVNIQCDYKGLLRYGDRIMIETTYVPGASAKVSFTYRITNAASGKLIVTGATVQVFLSRDELILQLTNPDFFNNWKAGHGLV